MITIDRKTLAEAAHVAALVCAAKNDIPILGNIHLDATGDRLTLIASNMDQWMRVRLDCSSTIAPVSWRTTVNHRALIAALDMMSGIDVVLDKNPLADKLSLRAPNGGWRELATLPADEFPMPSDEAEDNEVQLPREALLGVIDAVRSAASTEETRFYLNGIYVHAEGGKLHFVTTDGHRLHHATLPAVYESTGKPIADHWPGIIWPNAAVAAMRSMLSKSTSNRAGIAVSERSLSLTIDSRTLWSKAIDATLPDYRRVEPARDTLRFSLTAHAEEIARATGAVAALSDNKSQTVRVTLADDGSTISVANPDGTAANEPMADAVIDSPDGFEVGFNGKYVQAALAPFGAGQVIWQFRDASAPSLISGADRDDLTVTLMPMRI